jgi:hypothetical protein
MDYSTLTDQQLIEQIVTKDQNAAAFLFQEKNHRLFSYIRYSIFKNSHVELDEIINEFYVYLEKNNWEKLKEFQFRAQLTTWLSTAAIWYFRRNYKNLVIDFPGKELLMDDRYKIKDNGAENFIKQVSQLSIIYFISTIYQNPTKTIKYPEMVNQILHNFTTRTIHKNIGKANLCFLKEVEINKLRK